MKPGPAPAVPSHFSGEVMARYADAGADPIRRKEYTARVRQLAERFALLGEEGFGECPWVTELGRLEAGESVHVQGWQVGMPGTDYSSYWLHADGTITPYVNADGTITPYVNATRSPGGFSHGPPGEKPGLQARAVPARRRRDRSDTSAWRAGTLSSIFPPNERPSP